MKKMTIGLLSAGLILFVVFFNSISKAAIHVTEDGVYCDNGCDVYGGWGSVTICDGGTTNCIRMPSGTRILNKPL